MAEVAVTVVEGEAQTHIATWSGMLAGDVGVPLSYAGSADRSLQVVGELAGATVALEGSLEAFPPANWARLNDAQGEPIEIDEPRIEAVTELARWVRPVIHGGSGATHVTVLMLVRRTY